MPITGEKETYESTGKAYKTLKGTGGEENVEEEASNEKIVNAEDTAKEAHVVVDPAAKVADVVPEPAKEEPAVVVPEPAPAVIEAEKLSDGGQFSGGGALPTKRLTRKKHLKHKKPKHIKISINIGDKNHISASESSSSSSSDSSSSSSEEEEEEEATKIVPKKKRMSRRRRN